MVVYIKNIIRNNIFISKSKFHAYIIYKNHK